MDAQISPTEIKIVLIGESFVGKTSIVQRLTTNTFSDQGNPTLGAAFASLEREENGKKVMYQFWDTAGQEQYRDMAPMYFEGSNAIICVYSIIDKHSFESVDQWAKIVSDHKPEDHIFVIVGNKTDLADERKVQFSEGVEKAIRHNANYFEVSAKTGEGFDPLLTTISNLFFENEKKKQIEKQRRLTDNQSNNQAETAPTEKEPTHNSCCVLA